MTKHNWVNTPNKEPQRTIVYLGVLIVVKAMMQIALYRHGFISVSADEFARGIRAAKWAEKPVISLQADIQGTWLPLEKYLNGLFLFIFPDVIYSPRITVFIASCLLLVVVYLLTYHLFRSFPIAALTALFLAFQPWYVWLSGTPMLEMYYFACFFAGLLFLTLWLKEEGRGYWFLAGVSFMLATGFHVQSWTFINLVNLLTLPFLFRFVRKKDYANTLKLFAYYLLSNGVIIAFALGEYVYTGSVFAFLGNHTSYSRWFYGGYEVSVREKLLYYPNLVRQHSSNAALSLLFVGLVFLGWKRLDWWKLLPLLLTALALLANSVLNVFSGPPSAAPGRYSLFYAILLSMYVAYGTYMLFMYGKQKRRFLVGLPIMVAALALFISSIWWGASRIPNYPQGMSVDAVAIGRQLDSLLIDKPGVYMVELHYWDHLGVQLAAQHFAAITFDREKIFLDRNTPSIFSQGLKDACYSLLASPELRFVALRDESLKAQADQIELLRPQQHFGIWSLYEVVPPIERAPQPCD